MHHFCTIVTISKYEEKNLHCSNLTISISLKQSSYDQVAAAVIEYESNQRFSYNYLEMHKFYNEVVIITILGNKNGKNEHFG